jgi:hypothetical protein
MKQPSAKDKEIKGLLRALEWYQARYKPIEKLEESIRELKIELTDVYNDGLVLKKQHQEELKDQKAKILTILVDVLNYEAVTKQEKEIVCIIEEKIKERV